MCMAIDINTTIITWIHSSPPTQNWRSDIIECMHEWLLSLVALLADGATSLIYTWSKTVAVMVRKEARKVLVISGVERRELNLLEPQEDVGIP